jgi:anaerobic selenocysteine-containing dehydrogenase
MKLTRRHFLAWAGLGALGAVACEGFGIRQGELNVQSPVSLPEDLVRGKDNWYATLCRNCPASQGILVRVMEGRAKKVQGNPYYPTNQGKSHAPCEAGVQALYHPDRIPGPMKRGGNRGSGRFDPIAWDPEGMDTLIRQLNDRGVNAGPGRAVMVTKPMRGHLGMLTERFAQAAGIEHLKFEAADNNVYRTAVKNVYRQPGQSEVPLPDFDIENANFILSFGADFLSTWISPIRWNRGYGEFRQGEGRSQSSLQSGGGRDRGTLYHVDSRFSMTAANADKWIPVRPGWEGYLALSIAQVIVSENLQAPGVDLDALLGGESGRNILDAFRPEAAAPLTGITPEIAGGDPAEFIRKLARDFAGPASGTGPASGKGRSIAIAGGSAGAHSNGLFNVEAASVLNWLAGSVGATGGVTLNPTGPWDGVPATASASPIDDFERLAQRIRSGDVRLLLLHNADPVHGLPGSLRLRDAIESAHDLYVVSFSPFIDDTSALADLLLPDRVYLEDWGDDIPDPAPGYQTVGLQQPVVNPLWDLDPRSFPDVLLAAADGLGLSDRFPWRNYEAMLKEYAAALFEENRGSPSAQSGEAASADEFWTALLRRGGWWDESATGPSNPRPRAGLLRDIAQSASPPAFAGFGGADTLYLAPFSHNSIQDGSLAHLPWLQAAPDPVTSMTWQTWIEMNDATARRFGIRQGDVVRVESSRGSIRAVAFLTPATPPEVVGIPFGGGRRHGSDWATHLSWGDGRPGPESSNVNDILEPTRVAGPGSLAWAGTRVRISPTGESVMLSKMEGTTRAVEVGLSAAEEIIKTIQPGNY